MCVGGRTDRARRQTRDGSEEPAGAGRGELDEAHPLAIGVEAVGFSIDGYDRIRDQSADELTEAVLVSDKK